MVYLPYDPVIPGFLGSFAARGLFLGKPSLLAGVDIGYLGGGIGMADVRSADATPISTPLSPMSPGGEIAGSAGIDLQQGAYRVRQAVGEHDLRAAFRLRFSVFNLELKEGLESASQTGIDIDEFDPVCDHLIVERVGTDQVVGTYRLQSGLMAKANLGYYGEREFSFEPYEEIRGQLVELGRACIHRDHRSTDVLYLLWRGIAQYVLRCGARYLVGCSSLTSQDAAHGVAVYEALREYRTVPALRTEPQLAFVLPAVSDVHSSTHVPKLLRTYLAIGAKICGPPAIDREFKTIDFLTLLDLENLHPKIRARFFPRY